MKPVKAIDLVFKAQPIVSELREIAIDQVQNGYEAGRKVAKGCDEWLDAARELLKKKGDRR